MPATVTDLTVKPPDHGSLIPAKARWFKAMGFTREQLEAMDDPRCHAIAAVMGDLATAEEIGARS